MELKIGSKIFNVTSKDSILDNGKIYNITARKPMVRRPWDEWSLV